MNTHIQINSYDEDSDTFQCVVFQESELKQIGGSFDAAIPAFLMPIIAKDLCDRIEDLPHGMVNNCFVIKV